MPVFVGHLLETFPQPIEINRLFEIAGGAKLLAMFFRLSAGLTAHDNHRNSLSVAERCERLKQLITGIFGHPQIEHDGVRLMFEGKRQTAFRFSRIDDFVNLAQLKVHQPA